MSIPACIQLQPRKVGCRARGRKREKSKGIPFFLVKRSGKPSQLLLSKQRVHTAFSPASSTTCPSLLQSPTAFHRLLAIYAVKSLSVFGVVAARTMHMVCQSPVLLKAFMEAIPPSRDQRKPHQLCRLKHENVLGEPGRVGCPFVPLQSESRAETRGYLQRRSSPTDT